MAGDEGVHATGVGGEHFPRLGVDLPHGAIGCLREAELAVLDIEIERPLPENFRKLALGQPAAQIHLPEPVLRGHVTLRQNRVFERPGADVRHAAGVP